MPASTAAESAICGTHLDETKAPASTAGSPAADRASIRAILAAAGTVVGSAWSPSRGPTSTTRTCCGNAISCLLCVDAKQLGAFRHLVAGLVEDPGDDAVRRGEDRVLHLHRLQQHHGLAAFDRLADGHLYVDDLSRH